MRFAYYEGLSRAEKRAYDESDRRRTVPLPAPRDLAATLAELEPALRDGERARVEAATRALVDGLVAQLGAPSVHVSVLAARPADDGGELHGFYEMDERGCRLRVWMRTAAQKKPVAFRSFVRTVLHELCHHLDFARDGLDHSFHTHGFFARENDLARQLLPPSTRQQRRTEETPREPVSAAKAVQSAPRPKFLGAVKKRQLPLL